MIYTIRNDGTAKMTTLIKSSTRQIDADTGWSASGDSVYQIGNIRFILTDGTHGQASQQDSSIYAVEKFSSAVDNLAGAVQKIISVAADVKDTVTEKTSFVASKARSLLNVEPYSRANLIKMLLSNGVDCAMESVDGKC